MIINNPDLLMLDMLHFQIKIFHFERNLQHDVIGYDMIFVRLPLISCRSIKVKYGWNETETEEKDML
jgi:hypothetical protein